MEVGVQTDLFVDRPATPIYVPAKTGADAFTQIQPGDVSVLIKLLVRYKLHAIKLATTIISITSVFYYSLHIFHLIIFDSSRARTTAT